MGEKSTASVMLVLLGAPVLGSGCESRLRSSSDECRPVKHRGGCEATKSICWLVNFPKELGDAHDKARLYFDNMNNHVRRRSKHIDIKYELVKALFKLESVNFKDRIADYLRPLGAAGQLVGLWL